MSIEYQNVTALPILDKTTENTHVIVEDNGSFKRMSGDKLGGGVKTAIFRDSEYLNAIAGVQPTATVAPDPTLECINMTFEEAYETMAKGEPLMAILQMVVGAATCIVTPVGLAHPTMFGVPCIVMPLAEYNVVLYWTADGVSFKAPGAGNPT